MRQLGIWQAFCAQRFRPVPATFSAWGSPTPVERSAILRPGGLGFHLDRNRFERFLWREAERRRSFELIPASVIRAQLDESDETADDGLVLELDDGSQRQIPAVLDASGRAAVVARSLARRERGLPLVAVCDFLRQTNSDVVPTPATLLEALPGGWWYSALLPDRRLVACWFTDSELLPSDVGRDFEAWRRLVAASRLTRERIDSAGFAIDRPPILRPAGGSRSASFRGRGWIAAGDAAMAFDPLSSHGLTGALWSGRKAALAVASAYDGDESAALSYEAALERGWQRYTRELGAMYGAESRFATEPFWRLRASDDLACFPGR